MKYTMRLSRWLTVGTAVLCATILPINQHTTEATASRASNNGRIYNTKPWRKEVYPSPDRQARQCRTTKSFRFCDPDNVLDALQADQVEDALMPSYNVELPCAKRNTNGVLSSPQYEVQFAVALTGQLDLSSYRNYEGDSESIAARDFASYIHNSWGIGVVPTDIHCRDVGSTGVLLFLSDADRALYISRGQALASLLTDSRLDQVIYNMRPLLQQHDYVKAITLAIEEINEWLQKGEPGWSEMLWEYVWDYIGFIWVIAIFVFVFWQVRYATKKKRDYAKVASQLDELDRARAEALQGQFHATSCPICLEEFEITKNSHDHTKKIVKGSDGHPVKLLRCGHVFDQSCWDDWINSGKGTLDKCPICQQDVGRNNERPTRPGRFTPQNHQQPQVDDHDHDNNHGNNNNGRMRPPSSQPLPPASKGTQSSFFTNTIGSLQSLMSPRTDNSQTTAGINQQRYGFQSQPLLERQRIEREMYQRNNLERYMNERNFRLLQLQRRFPDVVRPQHLERWTQNNFQGSMAQDEAFVAQNPQQSSRSGNDIDNNGNSGGIYTPSFSHSGFGGGSSGGGRSGRW